MTAGDPIALLERKLTQFSVLSDDDVAALQQMIARPVHRVDARQEIIGEGEAPQYINLLLDGWACRQKVLIDGRRQITGLLLPGDLCDLNIYILREMDHAIVAVTPVAFVQIARDVFDAATEDRPRLLRALWWDTLVTMAIQREWTTDLGQRNAIERVAHLFLEIYYRLRGVGLTDGRSFDLPLTQSELADAVGMTPVHINRTLQELRAANLIQLSQRRLTLLDLEQLHDLAQFNRNYLHQERRDAVMETAR